MRIVARFDTLDPREDSFAEPSVAVDLRESKFVWPVAAFWWVIYSLLAKRQHTKCSVLVPTNLPACVS